MIIRNKPRINIYEDLLNKRSDIHAWKSSESYSIELLTNEEIENMTKFNAVEVCFMGVGDERNLYDSLYRAFDDFIIKYVLSLDVQFYLFISEFKPQLKNKIRTYKGIVPKEIDRTDFIQLEIPIVEEYTLLSSIIKLHNGNIKNLVELFYDSSRSFIITSKQRDFFTEQTLSSIVLNNMLHKGTSVINYLKIISKYCDLGDIIYRVGGDGGNKEIDFQVFCERIKKDLVILQVEQNLI
jgi:hypothetical protein